MGSLLENRLGGDGNEDGNSLDRMKAMSQIVKNNSVSRKGAPASGDARNSHEQAADETESTAHEAGRKKESTKKEQRRREKLKNPEIKKEDKEKKGLDEEERRIKEASLDAADEELQEFEKRLAREEMEGLHSEKRETRIGRITACILVALCVYMITLIYGIFVTDFHYGETLNIEPVILSIEEIKARNRFNNLLNIYRQGRDLYEDILTLDYRMAQGIEEYATIATDYQGQIKKISSLMSTIEAAPISDEYKQIQGMIYNWVKEECGTYCDDMSYAILQNSEEASAEATMLRENMRADFAGITSNMVTIGSQVKGVDVSDLVEWSPEGFIAKAIEGIE